MTGRSHARCRGTGHVCTYHERGQAVERLTGRATLITGAGGGDDVTGAGRYLDDGFTAH